MLNNDKPENIEIKIIGSEKPVRLQCLANFAFSKNLIIPLNIDAAVIPFDFAFEVFDYSTKKFGETSNIVFSEKNKILNFEPIILKFRVYLPKLFNNDTFIGKISYYYFPDYVQILNPEEIKNKEFEIKDKYEFNLNIKFNKKNYYSKTSTYIWISFNDNTQKKVIINFILNKLDKENTKYEKNLVKIHDSIRYSPFDYRNKEEEYYNEYKRMREFYRYDKQKNNIFGFNSFDNGNLTFYSLYSNNYGSWKDYNDFDSFLKLNQNHGFIIMYYDKKKEFWVPYPEIYPEEFESLKKFNLDNPDLTKEELNNISEEKKEILNKYRNNKDKKDFRFLIEKLIFNNKEDKITKILYEMINLFHPEIKEKLKIELDKIESKRKFIFWNIEINKWICYYNFIIELYHIFKERYIRLSNISKNNDEVEKFVVNLNKEYYTIKNIEMNEFNENKRTLNVLESNYNKS